MAMTIIIIIIAGITWLAGKAKINIIILFVERQVVKEEEKMKAKTFKGYIYNLLCRIKQN